LKELPTADVDFCRREHKATQDIDFSDIDLDAEEDGNE